MSSNKKDNNGWILCPSISFPGKFYYFNVLNGETAWSLNDADQKTMRKYNGLQKADKSHTYPEPSSPPTVLPATNVGSLQRTVSNRPRHNFTNIPPMFGQATFPTYISNVDPYIQNIVWTPIQLPVFAKPRQDQVTQTWEPEREIVVQACNIPLSKRFINYEEANTRIFSHIASNQNKNDQFTSSNYFKDQNGKFVTTPQMFGQISLNENKNAQYKMTNKFCNDKSLTNTQIFDPKVTFQNNDTIKKIVRQRTQSESDKTIENVTSDNQNYGVTSTQMFGQAHCSTKDHLTKPIQRQRTQSESDSIIFEKPHNYDNPISTFTTSNKGHNALQQNIVTSKIEDQNKTSFVMRRSILNPSNKVDSTSSQMKNTGHIENDVRKDTCLFRKDKNFLEDNKKGFLQGGQERNSKHDNEKKDLLDKLDKDDLRYTLVNKRRKSIDMGISSYQPEGNKIKTHKVSKQTETPKKRVTFDLYSETSAEEREGCDKNQPQYVNIHMLRRLGNVTEYWYIVVDAYVLLEDYEFIDKFVQLDGQCKLLVPHAVQSEIESYCFGDCRGQQRVIVARQLIRKLATPPTHIVVQPLDTEDERYTNMSTLGRILNCCLQIMERNGLVVLITDDSILYAKAESLKIHCYKLKEVKDGASRPRILKSDALKVAQNNNTNKNLFLQKDIDPTWIIPNHTSKNILKNCDLQTDMPPTTDANTSPINFEETIDKNHGKCNDYLNFDYDSNSDVTDISKTMKNLYIKDKNSNFILKKSLTKNSSDLDNTEHNSFTFQIKNKNIQKQNAKSVQSQILMEKSNNTQNSNKESIFTGPNDQLKNIKFQIQNRTPKKEIERNKNKNLFIDVNRRSMELKCRSSLQEELKNRFQVNSNLMEENIRSNIEEWICTFLQVMENALSVLLRTSNFTSSSLPPPWTLHETITCVKQAYNESWAVCVVADELSLLLLNNSNKQGQLRRNMKPEDFMRIFGCGVLLLESLQATEEMPEDITEAQQQLEEMLSTLQSGKEDLDIVRSPMLTKSDDEREPPKRQNFTKRTSEVLQYLKTHFSNWQCCEESTETPTLANEAVVTKNNDLKIVRTCGRNLCLVTIDKAKSMTLNEKENPTIDKQKEINSQTADNKKINNLPNMLSQNNIDKLCEINDGTKVVRLFNVATTFSKENEYEANEIKQDKDTENISQNTTDSTVKLYEEPKVVRIFDHTTPFPTKCTSKDANELILLSPKHGNTFCAQEQTAGPKVIRNIKLIDAFEEKLKFKVDMPKTTDPKVIRNVKRIDDTFEDKLKFKEETAGPNVVKNIKRIDDGFEDKHKFKIDMEELDYSAIDDCLTISISSQSSVINENDSNNDKISLNDQNNDKISLNDQNNDIEFHNDRTNDSANNKNSSHQKDYNDKINDDESNISTNVSFNDDRNNDVRNNDLLKPNDSSTNDSGFVNENDAYMLVQTFLSELSTSMKLIYTFIEDSIQELRSEDLQNDKKKKILEKASTTQGHLTGIIHKLQCIIQREADTVTPLKEVLLKADLVVVSDKRLMRYRQVVIKCLEQAQMLESALRLLLSIADGDFDVTFCVDNSVYFNIFE